ncbi:ThuA domain-containing protein [Dyadobacter tibetensis]|uniref:ThuA domain-containing protein n=1 Tax=Dyadobacter tibetensis TaxID=1211851 RepID=UPI001E315AF0|nr:ThuA domain-containing protein [Dyadobacter tibetensis]
MKSIYRYGSAVLLSCLMFTACSGRNAEGQDTIKENVSLADDFDKYKVIYKGTEGPGVGKNIVLVASDHEYRSEESLPQLAKILSKRYGFTCTVIFGLDEQGYILPGSSDLKGLEVLNSADLMVLFTRFSHFDSGELQHIDSYIQAGKPILALRTSTHAFDKIQDPDFAHYNWNYKGDKTEWKDGFGEYILGETWVSHYGKNHHQSSRLVIEKGQEKNPILKGVKEMWVQSGGYTAEPKGEVIARGEVLNGMTQNAPADKTKELLPVAWTRTYKLDNGASGRVFTTTHGASEDLLNDGFRRMLINASLWAIGMESEISETNNVDLVGPYKPTTFNFNGYKAQVKPADLAGWDSLIMPGEIVKKEKKK